MTGFIAYLLIFSWIWTTFHAAHIGITGPLALGATSLLSWSLLALYLALYLAIYALVYAAIPPTWSKPWLAGAVWVCLDQIRSVAFTGYPWTLLAHTQATNLPFLQLAAVTGAPGLTFLLVAFNVVVADLLSVKVGAPRTFLLVVFLVGTVHWCGWVRLSISKSEGARQMKVAVIQGNIDQYQKWDDLYEAQIRDRYSELVRKVTQQNPEVIVWPESAVPGWIPNEKFYVDWIRKVVAGSNCGHIIGAVSSRNKKDFNSAFLVNPQGEIINQYDKLHLVPFGEFLPFGRFLKGWIPYLGQLGTFQSGLSPVIFTVNKIRMAPNICYEAIFPGLIRKGVQQEADVIVNITNDGWFLKSGAPEQHFVTNIFRAVENGRPVIRAANTGISAVIDAYGRILQRSSLMTTDAFVQPVPLPALSYKTFQFRFPYWFLALSWVLSGLALFQCRHLLREAEDCS